ncbi:TPA: hypothetical protein DDY55_02360 [Candidatus Falkowbacteria bacterium]|nr:hypothetical protein [Candidatus Falkowbacteria bacterium]HAY12437.1 hypothetical protein [Candidatus Falkowbacteria bacterium]HBI96944.1 hypothetical protein [Candidatus Falkowbacteria bacterium]HBT27602.1 hypothetical protein [Candidatus Falkowbacteria bacterium]HBY15291.1 hypothetical protein [Candidatus Falkowbacteria bacterium]
MIYFTKYSEQKFEILNKYQVFFRKEEICDAVLNPDKISKKGKYLSARKDGIKVVYDKKAGVIRVITFYPIKI